MPASSQRYIPALGYRWRASRYDPVAWLTTREAGFAEVVETRRVATVFDTMLLYRARKPS